MLLRFASGEVLLVLKDVKEVSSTGLLLPIGDDIIRVKLFIGYRKTQQYIKRFKQITSKNM